VVWSGGSAYKVRVMGGEVTCTCPYSRQGRGYCKHICAVAVHELTELDVIPWLRRLDEILPHPGDN